MTTATTADQAAVAAEYVRNRLDRALLATLDQGDFAANLLHHLRTRSQPTLPFTPARLPLLAQLAQQHDPDDFAWEQRIASEALEGRLYAASNAYCDRFVELDRESFDFSKYEHFDGQAIHGLNRMRWLVALARRYWLDRDAKYFDALMREWDYFAARVPEPDETLLAGIHAIGPSGLRPPYSELDTFIRLTNWWWAFWLSLHAREMTASRCVLLLARCLKHFDLVAARGVNRQEHNFTSMQMEAIHLWSTTLPEVVGMNVWRHASRNILESSLARAVLEDGVQYEMSAGYHVGCIRWYTQPCLVGQRNGEAWSPVYLERLRKMARYVDAIITPDGKIPLISDSDRTAGWEGALSLLRCLFPDITFAHAVQPTLASLWISDGLVWEKSSATPALPTVEVFPNGGVGVARHRDPGHGAMVLFDNGPTHAGHSHEDNLSIHFDALGEPAIVDPGRWIYSPGPDREWVLRAASHNTIYIEDTPIAAGQSLPDRMFSKVSATGDFALGVIRSQERDGCALLTGEYRAHLADPTAVTRRTVVFPTEGEHALLLLIDQMHAAAAHTWTTSFLLPASAPVEAVEPGLLRASLDNSLQLHLRYAVGPQRCDSPTDAPLPRRDDAMFWCPNYAQKEPARWLRFSRAASSDLRVFVIHAARKGSPLLPVQLNIDAQQVRIAWPGGGTVVELENTQRPAIR